jgi:hypothetical protein
MHLGHALHVAKAACSHNLLDECTHCTHLLHAAADNIAKYQVELGSATDNAAMPHHDVPAPAVAANVL